MKQDNLTLQDVIEKHSKLFKDELGFIKDFRAHLVLKEGATPKFCKYRQVAFPLQKAVEDEIKRLTLGLTSIGVFVPVTTSQWATPLRPVIKKNGEIRLCADYSVTVNPCLQIEQYPTPTAQELFSKLHILEINIQRLMDAMPIHKFNLMMNHKIYVL